MKRAYEVRLGICHDVGKSRRHCPALQCRDIVRLLDEKAAADARIAELEEALGASLECHPEIVKGSVVEFRRGCVCVGHEKARAALSPKRKAGKR